MCNGVQCLGTNAVQLQLALVDLALHGLGQLVTDGLHTRGPRLQLLEALRVRGQVVGHLQNLRGTQSGGSAGHFGQAGRHREISEYTWDSQMRRVSLMACFTGTTS